MFDPLDDYGLLALSTRLADGGEVLRAGYTTPIVVGISGASGVVYGLRLLETLADVANVETHLVMTRSAELTLRLETDRSVEDARELADLVYRIEDMGATISSGSFRTGGMIVAPCSIKSLSGIVNAYSDNLLLRAADVTLKERRPLVLLVRETPLHLGHLRLLTAAVEIGATVFPPTPAFYTRPQTLDDLLDQTIGRVLDQFEIDTTRFPRWEGTRERLARRREVSHSKEEALEGPTAHSQAPTQGCGSEDQC